MDSGGAGTALAPEWRVRRSGSANGKERKKEDSLGIGGRRRRVVCGNRGAPTARCWERAHGEATERLAAISFAAERTKQSQDYAEGRDPRATEGEELCCRYVPLGKA